MLFVLARLFRSALSSELIVASICLCFLFSGSESRNSTHQKTQESTCLTSSPLPGDAPPNASVFCLETGGMTTQGQFYEQQGSRARGRGRGKAKNHTKTPAHTEVDKLKERHTLAISSLDGSPFLPKLGVGRRTSILFKKAKNGDKLAKSKLFSLQNRVSADQLSEQLPDHRSQTSLLCTPPTSKSTSKENGMQKFFCFCFLLFFLLLL